MRAIVSVATGEYVAGLDRLTEWCASNGVDYVTFRDKLPEGCPSHADVPYAFKSFALAAASTACDTLLWCDSCIIPIRPLEPLWERIERDGYWISNQAGPEPDKGWSNYEWTADSAYPDLFHLGFFPRHKDELDEVLGEQRRLERLREINRGIPHVVATSFGISLKHPTGRAIFEEYYRLASKTKAFCGPWNNHSFPEYSHRADSVVCGPPDVRGHRHDQTALSVIAWRLGCKLTRWPEIFAYRGHEDASTILVAG